MHPGQQPPRATAHSPSFEPSSSSAGWGSSPLSLTCRQASPPRPFPACLHSHAGEGTTEDGRSPFDDGASGRLQPPRIHLLSQRGWRAPGPPPRPARDPFKRATSKRGSRQAPNYGSMTKDEKLLSRASCFLSLLFFFSHSLLMRLKS